MEHVSFRGGYSTPGELPSPDRSPRTGHRWRECLLRYRPCRDGGWHWGTLGWCGRGAPGFRCGWVWVFWPKKKGVVLFLSPLYWCIFVYIYIYIYICDICILWIYHRHCGSPFVLHGVILKVVFPKLSRLRVALRCGQWWDLSLTIWFIGEAAISAFGGQGSTHFATGPRGLLDRWSGVFGRKRVLRVTLEVLPITLVAELRASPFWFWDIHGRSWRLIDADIERWRRWKRRWKWIHRFCP